MLNPALRLGPNTNVAEHFKVSDEAIRLWKIRGIPTDRALEVEDYTKGGITASEILEFAASKKRKNGHRRAA